MFLLYSSSCYVNNKVDSSCIHNQQTLVNGELKHNDSLLEIEWNRTNQFPSAVEDNYITIVGLWQFDLFRIVFLVKKSNGSTVVRSSAVEIRER